MYNRNPNDVARERTDAPEIYEEEHELMAESEAELRRTTDSVSGRLRRQNLRNCPSVAAMRRTPSGNSTSCAQR
jgi:hypothetical protein